MSSPPGQQTGRFSCDPSEHRLTEGHWESKGSAGSSSITGKVPFLVHQAPFLPVTSNRTNCPNCLWHLRWLCQAERTSGHRVTPEVPIKLHTTALRQDRSKQVCTAHSQLCLRACLGKRICLPYGKQGSYGGAQITELLGIS